MRKYVVEGAAGLIQGLYVMTPACLAVLASVRAVQGAWSDAVIVAAALLAYLFQSAVLRSEIAEHRVTTRCCADLRQTVADNTDENLRLRGGPEEPWAPEEISALQELLARTGARLAAAEADADRLAEALRAYGEYHAMPSDRGGKNGPKGKAFTRFATLREPALTAHQDRKAPAHG
jgi:hypothetical protein